MITLTQDVRLMFNNYAVTSATPEQNIDLEDILKEMNLWKRSTSEEDHTVG
jgi:hypothetical protein